LRLTRNNSSAIVLANANIQTANTNIRTSSNALLALNRNSSNAILTLGNNIQTANTNIRVNSNALLYLTKNNSNAILNGDLNQLRYTSNALLACCKNSSNSIMNLNNLIRVNSNASLALNKNSSNSLLALNRNSSNAILNLGNNIQTANTNIRVNSNASLALNKNNSNALLALNRNSSNAILTLGNNIQTANTNIRVNSNALLYLTKNNSNAILNGDLNQLRYTSNALLACCKNSSNSIMNLNNLSRVNSNAVLSLTTNNSNTLLRLTTNNSCAILNLNTGELSSLMKYNSSALMRLAANNSNALLLCCKNSSNSIVTLKKLVAQNSNSIVSDPNIYLDRTRTFTALATATFNHNNHFIHCSRDPNLFNITPGATLTLQNAVLKDFSTLSYSSSNNGELIFGDGVVIELAGEKNSTAHSLELKTTWTFAGGHIIIDGQGQELYLNSYNALSVMAGTTLTLQNMILNGLGNLNPNNIKSIGRDGTIAFRNVEMRMTSNYTFTNGYLNFYPDVILSGKGLIFTYASPKKSNVVNNAHFAIDIGVTFSYDSPAGKTQFSLDPNAQLYLNGCTLYSTRTGLHITQGTLVLDDRVTFTSEALYDAEGIELDSATVEVRVLPAAAMNVYGRLKIN
ncbi:hypothetical protein JST56_02105, partial [Candidatus Dependentiae bacterium]|nr:hypothetical protein [Candidatus Dependentiae bacterium]